MTEHAAPAVDHVVGTIGSSLSGAGWTDVALSGEGLPSTHGPVLARRTARFRWRWMATRLHTVVVAVPLRGGEDRAWLDATLSVLVGHVRQALRGVPLGAQAGIAVIPVMVGDELAPEVRQWASRPHGGGFAVIVHPVLVDLADGQVLEPRKRRAGAVYHSYLRELVAVHIRSHVAPAAVRPDDES